MESPSNITAEELRTYLRKKYNVAPFLTGSMALGLNRPNDADYDFGVTIQSPVKFNALVKRMGRTLQTSPYNKPGTDYHVFTAEVNGAPVDIALLYGEKGKLQRQALEAARAKLQEEERQVIVAKKQELKDSWFFPEYRYKRYKREIDAKLGLPKFKRELLQLEEVAGHLVRKDVYGHRTSNLEPIVASGKLLSAYELARKGLLKSYEASGPGRTRVEGQSELPSELRDEVFITKGLLPSDSSYGPYGVLFRKHKVKPSSYLNFIPEEHQTDRVTGKMTFVVPPEELEDWKKRYPEKKFISESAVPKDLMLPKMAPLEPIKRLIAQGITLRQSKGMLDKRAEDIRTKLLPHQQRVVERLRRQPGLVVAHGLGTGKTLSSIAAAADQGGRTTALVPASLIPNYEKELAKHLSSPLDIQVKSQQRASLTGEAEPTDLLIVDEAHKARETATKLNQLLRDYPAAKRLLLTATPVYNRPSDIAPLVNIAAGEQVLPTDVAFKERYIQKPPTDPGFFYRLSGKPTKPVLKNKEELRRILRQWVDYQDNTGGDFPSRSDEYVKVPMSDLQSKLHGAAWGKMPSNLRRKLEKGLLPQGAELSSFNKFQSQARQISGSTNKYVRSEPTPKTQYAINELARRMQDDPTTKAVVYSNYLNNLEEYRQGLDQKKIPYQLFTGNVSRKERQAAIEGYNSGALKALLLSSAGGEGLDLKGTRLVQVLEPHWNEEKLDQVIGRAIRHGSHTALPEDKRNVLVQHYITHPKASLWGRITGTTPIGVEDVLSEMSKGKKELNQQVIDLMR